METNLFDDQLKNLFRDHQIPAPDNAWSELSENLDKFNNEIHFDQSLREQISQARVTPPAEAWSAVQGALQGTSVITTGTISIFAKIIGAVLIASAGFVTWHFATGPDKNLIPSPSPADNPTAFNPAAEPQTENNKPALIENPGSDVNVAGDDIPVNSPVPRKPGNKGSLSPVNPPAGNNPQDENQPSPAMDPLQNTNNINATSGNTDTYPFTLMLDDNSACPSQILKGKVSYKGKGLVTVGLAGLVQTPVGAKGEFRLSAPAAEGKYDVIVRIVEGESVQEKIAGSVSVKPVQVPAFAQKESADGSIEFYATSSGTDENYLWRVDHKIAGKNNVLTYRFLDPAVTDHRVVLVARNNEGCVDSIVQIVRNEKTVYMHDPFIPANGNTFTPNGDGYGDVFEIKIAGDIFYNLRIYDLNGKMVYESKDKKNMWDGRNSLTREECPDGQYVYILKYSLLDGQPKEMNGIINLIR